MPPRKPTIRVTPNPYVDSDIRDLTLPEIQKRFEEAAKNMGVPVEDVRWEADAEEDYGTPCLNHSFYAYREKTKEEILADRQAAKERENADRERAREQIERLARQYPELMPYQMQELP